MRTSWTPEAACRYFLERAIAEGLVSHRRARRGYDPEPAARTDLELHGAAGLMYRIMVDSQDEGFRLANRLELRFLRSLAGVEAASPAIAERIKFLEGAT